MQLRITGYQGVTRWRWELQDNDGNHIADHEVNLDTDAQEYQGYYDSAMRYRVFSPSVVCFRTRLHCVLASTRCSRSNQHSVSSIWSWRL